MSISAISIWSLISVTTSNGRVLTHPACARQIMDRIQGDATSMILRGNGALLKALNEKLAAQSRSLGKPPAPARELSLLYVTSNHTLDAVTKAPIKPYEDGSDRGASGHGRRSQGPRTVSIMKVKRLGW